MRLDILNSRQFTYPGQHQPQKRFFAMRAGEERVFVAVNGEIGNAVPARVFNGLEIRWTIPANFTRADIMAFYKKWKKDFKRIHDGFETGYRNGNRVGLLTEGASDAESNIEWALISYQGR